MDATSDLCEEYVDQSLKILSNFGDNEASMAIEKILKSIL